MAASFETLGNATIQLFRDGRPVLATDPWLVGTCYFGSWALDHPLTQRQIANVAASDYIWISHGHPDHLHVESLAYLRPGTKILLPDHYHGEIAGFLRDRGFRVEVLGYRRWFEIEPGLKVMCLDNMNQDAVLAIVVEDALLINVNDSPVAGELSFLRRMVRRHPTRQTYVFALCSIDADMCNFVDSAGQSAVPHREASKRHEVWRAARLARRLGVRHFCCSSSQHVYVRADSAWANAHRITWADMQRYWPSPQVRLIEPFVTVEPASGAVTRNHPAQQPDPDPGAAEEEDWRARLSAGEWREVERFFARFELLRTQLDYVEVEVGGELRRFCLGARKGARRAPRSVRFLAPRGSLMAAVGSGYFDDLLIGNFMKVQLTDTRLYPHFTPIVAKLGGNAKVFTKRDYRAFRRRYFKRNPLGSLSYLAFVRVGFGIVPGLAARLRSIGLGGALDRARQLAAGLRR